MNIDEFFLEEQFFKNRKKETKKNRKIKKNRDSLSLKKSDQKKIFKLIKKI